VLFSAERPSERKSDVRRLGRLPVRCHESSKPALVEPTLELIMKKYLLKTSNGLTGRILKTAGETTGVICVAPGPRSCRGCGRGVLQGGGAPILRQIGLRGNPWRGEVTCTSWESGALRAGSTRAQMRAALPSKVVLLVLPHPPRSKRHKRNVQTKIKIWINTHIHHRPTTS
jgi:hypothetical protein